MFCFVVGDGKKADNHTYDDSVSKLLLSTVQDTSISYGQGLDVNTTYICLFRFGTYEHSDLQCWYRKNCEKCRLLPIPTKITIHFDGATKIACAKEGKKAGCVFVLM